MTVKFAIGVMDALTKDLSVLGARKAKKLTKNLNKLAGSAGIDLGGNNIIVDMKKLPETAAKDMFKNQKLKLPFELNDLGERQYHVYSAHVEMSDKTFVADNKYFSLGFVKKAKKNFDAAAEAQSRLVLIGEVEAPMVEEAGLDKAVKKYNFIQSRPGPGYDFGTNPYGDHPNWRKMVDGDPRMIQVLKKFKRNMAEAVKNGTIKFEPLPQPQRVDRNDFPVFPTFIRGAKAATDPQLELDFFSLT